MSLAQRIREAREAADLTLEELAECGGSLKDLRMGTRERRGR